MAEEPSTADEPKSGDAPQQPRISIEVAKKNKLTMHEGLAQTNFKEPNVLAGLYDGNGQMLKQDTTAQLEYSLIAGFLTGAIEKDPDGAVHRSWAAAFRWLLFQISRPRPGVDGEDYEARCEWLRKDFQLKVYNEPIRGKSYPKSLKTHLVSLGERIWGWAWDIFMDQYWDLDDDDMSKVREKSGGRDPLVHFTNQVFVENLHIRALVYDNIVLAHPGNRFVPYIDHGETLPVAHIKMSDECQPLVPGTNTGYVVWEEVKPTLKPGDGERHYYFICKERVDEVPTEPVAKKRKGFGGMARSESKIGDEYTTLLLQEARVLTGGQQIPITAEFTRENRCKLHDALGRVEGITFDLALDERRFQMTEVYTPLYHCLRAFLKYGELRPIHERSNDEFNEG